MKDIEYFDEETIDVLEIYDNPRDKLEYLRERSEKRNQELQKIPEKTIKRKCENGYELTWKYKYFNNKHDNLTQRVKLEAIIKEVKRTALEKADKEGQKQAIEYLYDILNGYRKGLSNNRLNIGYQQDNDDTNNKIDIEQEIKTIISEIKKPDINYEGEKILFDSKYKIALPYIISELIQLDVLKNKEKQKQMIYNVFTTPKGDYSIDGIGQVFRIESGNVPLPIHNEKILANVFTKRFANYLQNINNEKK